MSFKEHPSYLRIPTSGKKHAFKKGWEAFENGETAINCPYEPRVKDLIPRNPYYKYWCLGYVSCEHR